MQILPYMQRHRQMICRSVLCIILFMLIGILIQWCIPSSSSFAFKGRLFYSGFALALSLFLWNIIMENQFVFHHKWVVKWDASFVHQQEFLL